MILLFLLAFTFGQFNEVLAACATPPASLIAGAEGKVPASEKIPAATKAPARIMKKSPAKAMEKASARYEVTQNDQKAEKILNDMGKKYQSLKAFTASFSQTLENPNAKINETTEGDITVMGDKFKLSMSGQEVINNGTTIWTYMKNENEVNISDYEPSAEDISPNQIYTMYQKGYKYNFVKEENQDGQVYEIVELTPEDRSNPIYKVLLTINKNDKSLKSWQMFRNNGNRYTYTITKFTPNPDLEANYFTFDKAKHKDVKVIDLR